MKRNLDRLAREHFDIVIIGSGIHGAVLALEAVRSGYSVALLEKEDFGHATSANSLKIIHGGIRYLQHGDFKRMRESILSRRSMMNFAPHIVKTLACLMPTYGHGIKGREMMRLAFGIYDLVAFDRNRGLEKEHSLPNSSSISIDGCKYVIPGIKDRGLTGGAVWYDAIAVNTERLTLEYVKEAVKYGACVANYTEVVTLKSGKNGVAAVLARDCNSGRKIQIDCSVAVNSTGPWINTLSDSNPDLANQKWAVAINIVVKKRFFKEYAVGLEGYSDYFDKDAIIKRGKRLFFFVPWQEKYTMIGTTYRPYFGLPDDFSLTAEDISQALNEVNNIYPDASLIMEDVTFFHGGLQPMDGIDENRADNVQIDKSSKIFDHGMEGGLEGLFTIKGVKYTTAPDIAKRVIRILEKRKRLEKKDPGVYVPRSFRRKKDFGPTIGTLKEEYSPVYQHLRSVYGADWREVFAYLVEKDGTEDNDDLWVSRDPPLLLVELLYFIHEEMAVTLADVVLRRSNIGSAECPSQGILSRLSRIMGDELGWDGDKRVSQIEEVERVFLPLR